jgi:hypothetical protein
MEDLGAPRQLRMDMPEHLHAFAEMAMQDALFLNSTSFREQIGQMCRFLRCDLQRPVSYQKIADMFGVAKSTVMGHAHNFAIHGNECGRVGRPPILTMEQKNALANLIMASWQAQKPLRLSDVKNILVNEWRIDLGPDRTRFYHIIDGDKRLRTIIGKPIEDVRMTVTMPQIDQYFDLLERSVTGCPAHFVFNFDEMGYHAYADRRIAKFVVPSICNDQFIYYPVSRRGKRITLLACIAADGSVMRPAVIIARKTWENEFQPRGLTAEKLAIYSQTHSFINGNIFEDWFLNTFCPDLQSRRTRYEYWGPAFLILDNCSAHHGQLFDQLCQDNQVEPIFIPPHASNQVQPLDLCFFGQVKGYISRTNDLKRVNFQSSEIAKVVSAFYKASDPCSIVKSFKNGGISIVYDDQDETTFCIATKETCRCLFQPPTIIIDPNQLQHE